MIQFLKPINLNGTELLAELNAGGVSITEPPVIDGDNVFWLDITQDDKEKAAPVVAAHNGTIVALDKSAAKAAAQAKLAALGLTADELKALGL